MKSAKTATKKPASKPKGKRGPVTKLPRRQMTTALAEERAVGPKDGPKFDGVAFLRTLR